MLSVINFNSSLLTNLDDTGISLTTVPGLLLEFGIFVATPINVLNILSCIGSDPPTSSVVATFEVYLDGVLTGQTMIEAVNESQQITFSTIVSNVTPGHHVIQVFGYTDTANEFIVGGPINATATVYG